MRLTVKKSPISSRFTGLAWTARYPQQRALADGLLRATIYANRRVNMLPVYTLGLALLVFQWLDRQRAP